MKRIMVGGFLHETNTFNPVHTGLSAFAASARYGTEVLAGDRGCCLPGFLEVMQRHRDRVELVGSVCANVLTGGRVTDEAFAHFAGAMAETLDRYAVDGVYLDLHGAMVTESRADGEGALLEIIRHRVGPEAPIFVNLDMHATLTPLMVECANCLSIYRAYPHTDIRDRGAEVAQLALRTLDGEIRPVAALAKPPLLIGPPLNVLPQDLPMKRTYDRARELERTQPGLLLACPAQGFMQQDVPWAGVGVAVTTDGDRALAQTAADELGAMLFAPRREYWVELPDAAEAVRLARTCPAPPVAIADGGDNMGAGTPGDGTALLQEILRQGVDSAFVQLWDPEATRLAVAAGVGATVTLEVGGKSHPLYGPPVRLTGVVSGVADPARTSLAARLEVRGMTVLLNAAQVGPNSLAHPCAMGIDPARYRMSVCKGGFAFRVAYPPDRYSYVLSTTPGFSSTDLKTFDYRRIRRPIYPLDEI